MRIVTLVSAAFLLASEMVAADRHLAIVVDTSSSMENNDRQRYTVQLAQVLSDLAGETDHLSVVRMPGVFQSACNAGPSSSLVIRLDPADRARFKRNLDAALQFDTGTYFGAPVRTAISLLPSAPDSRRMLLVIADSGGLGSCEEFLTRELLALKRTGATIAAINLGGSSGAFDSNPAFDFTTASLDAQGLIGAVALVYQRFLGAKKVQTGRVSGDIEVDVSPYVGEAFLVVAADGPIAPLSEIVANPGRQAIDLDHRGGGVTRGLDGKLRGYRIVRLDQPAGGRWRFRASGLGSTAGWMLLQDSAIGVRLVTPVIVPKGVEARLEVELFDQRSGKRIGDTSKLPGLKVTADVNGRELVFQDDGRGADRVAGDGTLSATASFQNTGDHQIPLNVQSEFLDRSATIAARVVDAAWQLEIGSPKRAEIDRPVTLALVLRPVGSAAALRTPDRIAVLTGGASVELRDDGRGPDRAAGDRVYSAQWVPPQPGTFHLVYVPQGGSPATQVSAELEVSGKITFGKPIPIRFGRLESESTATRKLDISGSYVRGAFDVTLHSAFDSKRSRLEIDLGNGWKGLDEIQTIRLTDHGPRSWPVRLRVGECPAACSAVEPFFIVLTAKGVDGRLIRTNVPVSAEIVADPWLLCWWPVLAAVATIIVAGVVAHGYWSPSRFPPQLGVLLSPEEDLNEGFFHPIRGQRGSRSGFYRDARIYVCQDFRLDGRPRDALARLRADHKQVRIEPAVGALVWKQNAEGVWEQMPNGESTARFGDLYRNDHGTLFFELRNA
ncbi:MAG TPA: vWA domain-containing protein [Thermoanaerobaculia bacterium]|nr:vWA domain-containing protein [Thermoanaerobaculia bacterium]